MKEQYVYVLECQNYYKIGYSCNVASRLSNLKCANPFPVYVFKIYLVNSQLVERMLHRYFAEFRKNGEWFALKESQVKEIDALVNAFNMVCTVLPEFKEKKNRYKNLLSILKVNNIEIKELRREVKKYKRIFKENAVVKTGLSLMETDGKKCLNCGTEINFGNSRRKYCCTNCRQEYWERKNGKKIKRGRDTKPN